MKYEYISNIIDTSASEMARARLFSSWAWTAQVNFVLLQILLLEGAQHDAAGTTTDRTVSADAVAGFRARSQARAAQAKGLKALESRLSDWAVLAAEFTAQVGEEYAPTTEGIRELLANATPRQIAEVMPADFVTRTYSAEQVKAAFEAANAQRTEQSAERMETHADAAFKALAHALQSAEDVPEHIAARVGEKLAEKADILSDKIGQGILARAPFTSSRLVKARMAAEIHALDAWNVSIKRAYEAAIAEQEMPSVAGLEE